MIKLFTDLEFNNTKSKNLLPLKCKQCSKIFYITKHEIQRCINPNTTNTGEYCSNLCSIAATITTRKLINCKNCNKEVTKTLHEIKTSKNQFCSQSCAATYNNKHKKYGIRRSKLEKLIEQELNIIYPYIKIDYNKKDKINSELDIYIPSLNIAIELNGIFHYKPIYGLEKFNKIIINDINKIKECNKNNIKLYTIDTSTHSRVNKKTSIKYINKIVGIIYSHSIAYKARTCHLQDENLAC